MYFVVFCLLLICEVVIFEVCCCLVVDLLIIYILELCIGSECKIFFFFLYRNYECKNFIYYVWMVEEKLMFNFDLYFMFDINKC